MHWFLAVQGIVLLLGGDAHEEEASLYLDHVDSNAFGDGFGHEPGLFEGTIDSDMSGRLCIYDCADLILRAGSRNYASHPMGIYACLHPLTDSLAGFQFSHPIAIQARRYLGNGRWHITNA